MSAVGVTLPQTYRLNYALQQSVSDAENCALRLATQQNILHPSEGPSELAIYSLITSEQLSTEAVLSSVEQCTMITTSAESSIRDLQGIVMRQYELAARAVNVLGDNKKIKLIDAEFQQLNSEINRIVSSTTVNGIKILKDITGGSNFVTDTTGTIKGTQSSVLVPIDTTNDKMIQINGINMYIDGTAQTAAVTKRTTQEICFDVADFSGAGKSASGTICTLTLGAATTDPTKPTTAPITIGAGSGDINVPVNLLTDVSSKIAAENIANAINEKAGNYYKDDGSAINPYYGLTARVTNDHKLAISYIADCDSKFAQITNITLRVDLADSTTITDGIVTGTNNTCTNNKGAINVIIANDNGPIGQSFVLNAKDAPTFQAAIDSVFGANGTSKIAGIIPINKSVLDSITSSFDATTNKLTLKSKASTMAGDILVLKNSGATNNIYVTTHDGNQVGSLGIMNASVTGDLGNNLIAPVAGAKGTTGTITIVDGDILEGTKLTIGGLNYTFTADPIISQENDHIQLISDNGKTNIKQTLMQLYNKFSATDNPFIKNLELNVSNDTLTVDTRVATNHYNGLTVNFDTQKKGGTMLNGYSSGIDVSGLVDNKDIIGKISSENIKVAFTGQNTVNIAISFGGTMFSCNNLNTQNIGTYRFDSNQGNGSYINITFATPQDVSDVAGAEDFAAKLSTALSNASFFQRRAINNFDTTNLPLLMNATAEFNTDSDNPNLAVESITVTSADSDTANSQAFITIKTNDGFTYKNVYESDNDNCMIFNAGSSMALIGTDKYGNTCLNNKIILTFGKDINFITDESAAQLQNELSQAFKAGQDGVIIAVSADLKQKITITIPDLSTDSLYGKGILPNVATKQDAESTAGLVSSAIEMIVSALCEVGAYQSRMNYIIQSLSGDVESLSSAMDIIMLPDTPTVTADITNSIALIKATIFSMTQMRQINDALSRLIS